MRHLFLNFKMSTTYPLQIDVNSTGCSFSPSNGSADEFNLLIVRCTIFPALRPCVTHKDSKRQDFVVYRVRTNGAESYFFPDTQCSYTCVIRMKSNREGDFGDHTREPGHQLCNSRQQLLVALFFFVFLAKPWLHRNVGK